MQDRVPVMLGLDQIVFRRQMWRWIGKRWFLFGRPGWVGVGYCLSLFVGWFEGLSVPEGAGGGGRGKEGGERSKRGTKDPESVGRRA